MAVEMKTPGVHHVTLRVGDFERAKNFYLNVLGFESALEAPNLLVFLAGKAAIGVRGPTQDTPPADQFSPFRIGMDHLALACESDTELERVAHALDTAHVENTGIKLDETLGKRYVAFKDPDRISWELYMA